MNRGKFSTRLERKILFLSTNLKKQNQKYVTLWIQYVKAENVPEDIGGEWYTNQEKPKRETNQRIFQNTKESSKEIKTQAKG